MCSTRSTISAVLNAVTVPVGLPFAVVMHFACARASTPPKWASSSSFPPGTARTVMIIRPVPLCGAVANPRATSFFWPSVVVRPSAQALSCFSCIVATTFCAVCAAFWLPVGVVGTLGFAASAGLDGGVTGTSDTTITGGTSRSSIGPPPGGSVVAGGVGVGAGVAPGGEQIPSGDTVSPVFFVQVFAVVAVLSPTDWSAQS